MAFAYLAAASALAAIFAVTRRNPTQSVLWVLALFLHVAGIFFISGAQFLAAVQIIIYAGAILVFYLIMVMLLDWDAEKASPRYGSHWILGAATGLGFVCAAAFALRHTPCAIRRTLEHSSLRRMRVQDSLAGEPAYGGPPLRGASGDAGPPEAGPQQPAVPPSSVSGGPAGALRPFKIAGTPALEAAPWQPSVADIGRRLFGNFAVHFESASLILLAAIVGAIVLAKHIKPGGKKDWMPR